ncbi:MAG: hypothetical protein KAH20_04220 [Methylococcales bacterium]|nr:hypothetical protein [Methylococcales bacterium]
MLKAILVISSLFLLTSLQAAPRYSDPDGCMSCHALEGLSFIDKKGVTRSISIDRSHYYSSLHGSVPCKDCHRKIVDYPHKVENGYADCTESCHVEEPSEGKPYTHKPIHKEMEKSVHGDGWFKDLAGGNRLEEIETEQDPSCRRCHSNTLYILESQLENFKDAFDHAETECGTCHQGKAWMGQFGGHILRRFVGSRWVKNESNKLCMDCHGDVEKMRDVEIEDPETKEKHPPSERFIHAVESYKKTLHGRLLIADSEYGASCIDCHAPSDWRHNIGHYEDEKSASHSDELKNTCGQSDCHGYAKKPGNTGFVETDMHDMSMIDIGKVGSPLENELLKSSAWFWSAWPFLLATLIFMVGSLIWWLFYRHNKKIIAILGGDRFERVMIGRKSKKARVTARKSTVKQESSPTVETTPVTKSTENTSKNVIKLKPHGSGTESKNDKKGE